MEEGCAPLFVDFINNAPNTELTEWIINGQTVSNQPDLLDFPFESLGTQLITILVGDGDCTYSFVDSILVTADCVWPGDVDNDGVVGVFDWLALGLVMNDSVPGVARAEQNIEWTPKEALDWSNSSYEGVNYKFADTNGDGVVDAPDTSAIINNFDLTHVVENGNNILNGNEVAEIVPILVQNPSSGNGEEIVVDLYLNQVLDTVPLELSGFAFDFIYRGTDPKVDFSQSCMGTEGTHFITLVKDYPNENKLSIAVTNLNGHNLYCTGIAITVITRDNVNSTQFYQSSSVINPVMLNSDGELLAIGAQPTIAAPGIAQGINLQLTAFLEEAFDEKTNEMHTANMEQIRKMRQNPLVSAHLPEMARLPFKLTDWIMVEALDQNRQLVERQPAFLLSNGNIVSMKNTSEGIKFNKLKQGESYFFILRHTSHLDVMSAQAIAINGGALAYDFTKNENIAGNNQMTHLSNGKYALSAGDFNADGLITVHDFNANGHDLKAREIYKANAGKIGVPAVR